MKNFRMHILFGMLFVQAVIVHGSEDTAFPVDFNDPVFSRLDEEGKNVIKEFARHLPIIKTFYGNIRMDVSRKVFRYTASKDQYTYIPLNGPPILREERLFEVRYNKGNGDILGDGFARVDKQVKFRLSSDPRAQQRNAQGRSISLITPEMGYSLSKSNAENPFYSLNMKRSRSSFMSSVGVEVLGFDTAPFSLGPFFIEDLFTRTPYIFFKGTSYFVVSARYIEDEQEGEMVELISQTDRPQTPSLPSTWTVRFLRDSWVVKDAFVLAWSAGGHRFWQRYRREYDGEVEGMPLLSSCQEDFGIIDPDDGKTERLLSRVQYEVTKIIPGPPDLSEFDVAQFLPPGAKIEEVPPLTFARLSPARIAAIVVGIVLIILGIYLRMRNRNRI
jgi:hypothetical protein